MRFRDLDETQRKTGRRRPPATEQRGRHTAFAGRGEQTLKGLGERRAKRELERLAPISSSTAGSG